MDVAAWLRGLSLERYGEAFRDNAIELEVLPELSEADLEVEMGERALVKTSEVTWILQHFNLY
jgi:hypothetical protein